MKKLYITFIACLLYCSITLAQENIESRLLPNLNCEMSFTQLEAMGKGRKEARHTYYLAGIPYSGCASSYLDKKEVFMIYHMEDGKILKKASFLENGLPLKESNYQDGRLHGEVITYSQSGEKFLVERFYQGLLHGTTQRFYASGNLSREAEYRFGELIREIVFSRDGSIQSTFPNNTEN